ncbi:MULTISPECIES: hypothetical protein [Rhodococcus]|uniref:hypothetical protein n=1 Tax=Rhodococcus TaxID=1827 RepID=UPI0034DE4ADA
MTQDDPVNVAGVPSGVVTSWRSAATRLKSPSDSTTASLSAKTPVRTSRSRLCSADARSTSLRTDRARYPQVRPSPSRTRAFPSLSTISVEEHNPRRKTLICNNCETC